MIEIIELADEEGTGGEEVDVAVGDPYHLIPSEVC